MATKTNAEIAAAFEELGDLYELDGAVSYRVIAYRTAAKAVRDASVSIMALTREGKVTTVPGIGKTLEEKLKALDETGDIPSAVKLRAKFPVGLIAIMHLPGFGAKRAKLLYDELGVDSLEALREKAEAGEIRKIRGLGARGRGEPAAGAGRARGGRRRRRRGSCSRGRSRWRSRSRARCATIPAADRVEIAGSRAPAGRHGQGHRHHRHRRRRRRADLDARRAASSSSRSPQSGEAGARVVTHSGMKVDLRVVAPDQFGNVLQHFTGSKAHNVQLREAAVRRGLHVSEYGILDDETGETTALRDRGGGLRAARLRVDPAGAARGARRARGGAQGHAAEADRAVRPARRPALPHDALRRAPDARADGRGGAARAAGSTWRSPTTRPRTGSATTSRPRRWRRGSRRSRR